ncbi:MAG: hypothetical protein J6H21_02295 [Firmicutes bacterium]|nr:hypothetical protein [Bacillota bacterium]
MNTKLSQSKGKSFLTRVLTMFLIVALLFGMAPSGTFAVYAEDSANAEQAEGSGITSWSQLKDAIEKGTDAEISISGKLIATEEINVSRPVKITGNATIYRSGAKGANQDFSNFVVGAGGDLTLSGGVTMTGDRECVAGQPISEDKINEEKTPINQIGDDVKPVEHTETGKQYWMYSDKGILLTTDASKASTFTIYNDSKKVIDYVAVGIRIFIGYGDKFLKDMTHKLQVQVEQ